MHVMKRLSRFVTANINHLLDQAEDPEATVKQMILDIEESIAEVRRATVRAVAHQKQIEKQLEAARAAAPDLEGKARLALARGEEELARQAVRRKLQAERAEQSLGRELEGARAAAAQLKLDLGRLEDQVQIARRRRDELFRRRQAAAAQLGAQQAARRSAESLRDAAAAVAGLQGSGAALASYEAGVLEIESQAEAERDVLLERIDPDLALEKMAEEHAVEQELQRLRELAS